MSSFQRFNPRWRYTGDINLEHGGLYWRPGTPESFPQCDYVEAVQVTPVSDMTRWGADNVFIVESGSIYMPRDRYETALDCCGYTLITGARGGLYIGDGRASPLPVNSRFGQILLVDAFNAYHGVDRDTWAGETLIRIGPEESDPDPEAEAFLARVDEVHRADAKLENIVRRGFL